VTAADWGCGEGSLRALLDICPLPEDATSLASSAIPGIFPPVDIGPLRLYDGGLVTNSP
jgi:predicted acylesterase/phospholipase RssA